MIEFHDRGKEIQEIMRILNTRPDLITFVYGPINSGKTELFQHLIRTLPKDFVTFYINLRHIYVSKADDFLKILFEVKEKKSVKTLAKEIVETYVPSEVITPIGRFPIPKNLFRELFKEKSLENVFVYLETLLSEIAKKGKRPILILDELQKIGDVKIDGLLIYELFNFFIALTKESHLAHVFAITSDSLFIEKVFNEAMLHGRCRYLLIDDFDYETTKEFLQKHGFNREEIELAWQYLGGKPVYLVEAVKNKDTLKEFCEKLLKVRTSQILDTIFEIEDSSLFNGILSYFKEISEKEVIRYRRIDKALKFCVKNNILFLDPVDRIVKPQSKLDLLAIRDILQQI